VSVLEIRVLGDPILRKETAPVAAVSDEIRKLIDDMFDTMYAAKGIGLAAPQVGRLERVAVEGHSEPIALVNPEVVFAEGSAKAEEGCLSIPDVFGDVERPANVVVRALDREGTKIEIEATELLARCFQHEIDHLHGKLFIDYLSVLKRRSALAKWAKQKDRYPNFIRRLTPQEVAEHHTDEDL
jgi:peptide deformylase